jgi:hypothetical protein
MHQSHFSCLIWYTNKYGELESGVVVRYANKIRFEIDLMSIDFPMFPGHQLPCPQLTVFGLARRLSNNLCSSDFRRLLAYISKFSVGKTVMFSSFRRCPPVHAWRHCSHKPASLCLRPKSGEADRTRCTNGLRRLGNVHLRSGAAPNDRCQV